MSIQFDNLGDLKPKITAGGKDNTKFVPNLNVSFFDDEFYFNLNRKDKIIKNEKAATASGKTSLGGIDTDIWYIDDKGRFKWDIEFASRPKINSWTWELKHAKGIEFYYQGELTVEEIADGCVRPDEVVGSYAVYCNKANNKYKTGKLCHIYRPFCYDAKGKTIYADLNIADGQLTITIDAAWLDSAAYPVRLDPTIGYTSVGATEDKYYSTLYFFASIQMGSADGVASVIKIATASESPHNVKIALYDDNSGSPNDLMSNGYTGALGITRTTKPTQDSEWTSGNINSNLSANNVYHIGFSVDDNSIKFYFDSGSACRYTGGYTYNDFPIATIPSTNSLSRIYSAYLSYTESGSTGGSLVGQSSLVGGGMLCGQGNLIN